MALKLKIRKGDEVIVITGKDKGKKGEVTKVIPQDNKVIISGINVVKKHTKPSKLSPHGGIIPKEMPISISNVAHIDPKTDMPTKIGLKLLADGKKIRYAKRSGEVIDNLK